MRFYTEGLLSKWGFSDGDQLREFLYDLEDEEGTKVDHHAVLIAAVRKWVVPAIREEVEVDEITTIHNPIRARSVNGTEVDVIDDDTEGVLHPEFVDVADDDLRAIAREVALGADTPHREDAE